MKSQQIKKVVLLGNSSTIIISLLTRIGVGKTSIIKRFITGEFKSDNPSSKMAAFFTKEVEAPNSSFKLQVWDTMGQEKYNSLAAIYYKDADVVILVFDKTQKESFERVKELFKSIILNSLNNPCRLHFIKLSVFAEIRVILKEKTLQKLRFLTLPGKMTYFLWRPVQRLEAIYK